LTANEGLALEALAEAAAGIGIEATAANLACTIDAGAWAGEEMPLRPARAR